MLVSPLPPPALPLQLSTPALTPWGTQKGLPHLPVDSPGQSSHSELPCNPLGPLMLGPVL